MDIGAKNKFSARSSGVTGVSSTRAVPERWRDGPSKGKPQQASPVKPEVESKEEAQSNPNESLSDWEQEFLGKLWILLGIILGITRVYR